MRAAVDAAIRDLNALVRADVTEDDDSPEALVDWVIVTGSQFFDADGERCGAVSVLPREGSQPSYVTVGLLSEALGKY
ncbi:DUF7213 family protein [Rhodococcoides fascians]|uniref:DUF7213 family protein n=1 Tax=Rhodococcoides fascians TaxID=1828 RepID=UPI0037BDDC7E